MEDWREVGIDWQGDLGFIGHNQTGGRVQVGKVNNEPGISPIELLLISLAGCTGADVVSILEKKRQKLSDFKITVRGLRREEHPRKYTDIEVIYHFWGQDLAAEAVERAIYLSETKYCSVSAMLKDAANLRLRYVIHQADTETIF